MKCGVHPAPPMIIAQKAIRSAPDTRRTAPEALLSAGVFPGERSAAFGATEGATTVG